MAKKKQEEKEAKAGDIRVLVTALNLILLVFFVYINTIGENDEERVKKALASLTGTFSILPGGLSLSPGKEISDPGIPLTKRVPDSGYAAANMKRVKFQEGVREVVKSLEIGGTVTVSLDGKDLVIYLDTLVLFKSGTAEFTSGAEVALNKIGDLIKKIDLPIRVEGHTDDQRISTQRYRSNWELSAARAISILQYLVNKKGISPHRLSAVGYGEFQPLVPNQTPEQRARNRRVNIVFLGAGSS